jgi:hypothetical protein
MTTETFPPLLMTADFFFSGSFRDSRNCPTAFDDSHKFPTALDDSLIFFRRVS